MSKKGLRKIVLATGIFFPDIGGPAIHVKKIGEALLSAGWNPVIVTYSDATNKSDDFGFKVRRISRRQNKYIRWLKYFFVLGTEAWSAKIIYAFNITTAGIPALIWSKILPDKKSIIRIAGDPIWERITERNIRFLPITKYYEDGLHLKDKPLLVKLISFVLPRFDAVVTYTLLLKKIYTRYYKVNPDKVTIIKNPVYKRGLPLDEKYSEAPTFIFAGRFVAYKNIDRILYSFNRVWEKFRSIKLILIGDGPDRDKIKVIADSLDSSANIQIMDPLPQEKLFEQIRNASVGIGAALTEFNPNFILECISFGKPVLISRENGLSVTLPEDFLFDPLHEQELAQKMEIMCNPDMFRIYTQKISDLCPEHTWSDVTGSHLGIINTLLGHVNS